MKNRGLNIPFWTEWNTRGMNSPLQAAWILNFKNYYFYSEIYISSLFMYLIVLLIHF